MPDLPASQPGLFDATAPAKEPDAAPAMGRTAPMKQRAPRTKTPAASPPPPKPATRSAAQKSAPAASRRVSGQVPPGDVRLTANIDGSIHLKLKIVAAHRRTTIGELIEELVENYLESPYGVGKK